MLTRNGAVLAIALLTLSPFSASAATSIASSTAASSTPTIAALQSLITQLESEFAALVAARETSATPASEPAAVHVTFTRVLSLGSEGADVSALQQILKSAGFYTYPTITGYFGPLTEKALAAYQTTHGLDPVGYTGPKTRALLNGVAGALGSGSAAQPAAVSPSASSPSGPATTATAAPPESTPLFPIAPGYGGGGGVTTPPTISGTPSNSTSSATSPAGAAVTYATPTATDALGETDAVSCSPTSGSTFALGVTTVICTTTDKFGNSSHSSFSVTVQDTTAPSVALTAPSNGATVSGSSVTLTANASDTTAVASVQFEVDGTDIGSAITASPYTTTWNSKSVSDGSHTLYAVADSTSGNYATSSVRISVRNNPPVITSISSGSPTPYSATITWTTDEPATSQVNHGTTTAYGTASSSAALVTSHSIALTGLTASIPYHFQVESVDGQGNTATSSDQTFTTPADTHAPSVSISAPANGATVSGSSVTLTASASDTTAVASVQFGVDGANIGAAITSSPYTTMWNSTGVADGSHTLSAVAKNTVGNYATSSFSVSVDNTPPAISAITPNSIASSTETITWTTNKAATSVVSFGLTTSYGSASSSATLVTSHSIALTGLTASTTYDFEVSSADSQGNTATSSNQTFTTAAYNYYVDSVNGNDANPGTSPALAFQNPTALPTITAGQSIALADGSHWRQQLTINAANVTVTGYGSGALPILDGSDVLPNAGFTKTAGYTNVYNTGTITFVGPESDVWINVFETGASGDNPTGSFLTNETTEPAVDSTACSYYIPGLSASTGAPPSPAPIYIHSCDGSSPITSGYTYEVAQRTGLLMTSMDGVVHNIEFRKGADRNGEIVLRGDGYSYQVSGIIARDGNFHNMLLPSGSTVASSTFVDSYIPSLAGASTLLVFYDNTGSGLPITASNNTFQTDQPIAGNTTADAIYEHTASGNIGAATLNGNWYIAKNGTALTAWSLQNIASMSETGDYGSNLYAVGNPLANATITSSQFVTIGPSVPFTNSATGNTITINNSKVCSSNIESGYALLWITQSGVSVSFINDTIYLNSQNAGVNVILRNGSSSNAVSWVLNGNDLGSNVSGWYALADTASGSSFSGDNNIYEAASHTPSWHWSAGYATTLAKWQSYVTPADAHATESGGNAIAACTLPTIPTIN
jgi:hypothetical protein